MTKPPPHPAGVGERKPRRGGLPSNPGRTGSPLALVLVDGEPGIGKSLLLRDAADEAAELGFSLAEGVADQLGQAIPFFSLRAALREPLAGLTADHPGYDPLDGTAWWIARIRAHLEQRAAAGVEPDTLFFPARQPRLGHEYQFDLDTAEGPLCLNRMLAFLQRRLKLAAERETRARSR